MRIHKLILPAFASSLILMGCGGSAPLVSTPIANIDTMPLKVTPLTEEEIDRLAARFLEVPPYQMEPGIL